MKILWFFLQHLSEVVHIPHTKMQKYTDIHDYLHITEGNYGNALESQFSRRTDHFRPHCSYWPQSAETRTRDNVPVGQCPLRHCSCSGFSQIIRITRASGLCWDGPLWMPPKHPGQSRLHCSLSKLHQRGAGGAQCLPCSAQHRSGIFVHDWNFPSPPHWEVGFDSSQR